MLSTNIIESICDIAWELGYDWDDSRVVALWEKYKTDHPEAVELPINIMELYRIIEEFEGADVSV